MEVAIGEVGEHVEINLVFAKLFLVLAEAEATEPYADIHDRALTPINGSLILWCTWERERTRA